MFYAIRVRCFLMHFSINNVIQYILYCNIFSQWLTEKKELNYENQ